MKSFIDNAGRVWTLSVNVAAIKRVRAICGVDLNSIIELDSNNNPTAKLLERLSSDPVLLVDVLYAVCKPEADTQNISDEEFGRAMTGDTITNATNALLDEVVDFFPEAKRMVFRKILSASRRFEEVIKRRMNALLTDERFEDKIVSRLEQLTGLSGNVQESAE